MATLTGLLPHQATVLEEMPPFPERESSILAKLKKKKGPSTVTGLEDSKRERRADINGGPEPTPASAAVGPSLTSGPRMSSRGARSSRIGTSRAFAHWGECLWNTKVCAMSLAVASSLRPSPVPPWNPRNFSSRHTVFCCLGSFTLLSGVPVQLLAPPHLDFHVRKCGPEHISLYGLVTC